MPHGNRAETARATDKIFRDRELADRLGDAAAKYITERRSLEAAIAAYEHLYERLLAEVAAG